MTGEEPPLPPVGHDLYILAGLAYGDSYKEVAEYVRFTVTVVQHRISRMIQRYGVSTSAALVAKGCREGWLDGLSPELHADASRVTAHQEVALELISQGFHTVGAARRAGIERVSMKQRMDRVRKTLGARNYPHAVFLSYRLGVLPVDHVMDLIEIHRRKREAAARRRTG